MHGTCILWEGPHVYPVGDIDVVGRMLGVEEDAGVVYIQYEVCGRWGKGARGC